MRRALATLAALHAADAAFECVRDAHGCCSSAGYFFCGSSGRCTGRDDPCEDGASAAAARDVRATLKRDGAVASWDLQGLTRTSSLLDYEAKDGASKVIFNVCANANPPNVCPSPQSRRGLRDHEAIVQGRRRVGGRRGHGSLNLSRRFGPDAGRRLGLFWPGPVFLSAAGAVLGIRRQLSEPTLISSTDCTTITEVESVHGCPLGCAREDGRGLRKQGPVRLGESGRRVPLRPRARRAPPATRILMGARGRRARYAAIIVLVVSLCAAVVAARCVAFRKRRLATLRAGGPTRPSTPPTTRTRNRARRVDALRPGPV